MYVYIQDVPKFVIKNSDVITSGLEVTIWSGTYQKMCLVLQFSFKPPDYTPLVRSCLEIPPIIVESYTSAECAQCFSWFTPIAHFRSEKIQNQVSQKSPQRMNILAWYNLFLETGCVSHRDPGQGRPCVAVETIGNLRQTFVCSPHKSWR